MNDDAQPQWRRGNSGLLGRTLHPSGGFTIVETLIVLGVSGVLFLAAILLVTGQQRKVEFTQAAQEIRSAIEQTITEVGTGYYNNPGNIRCTVSGGNPVVVSAPTGTAQGSNTGCIFLGKAIQFGVADTDPQQYIVHSLVGLQDNDGSLASVRPRAIDIDGVRSVGVLRNGLQAVSMRYVDAGMSAPIGAVAFVNGLGGFSSDNQLMSGTQQVSLVPVPASGQVPNTTKETVVGAVNSQLATAPVNPDGGVLICFNNGGDRSALVTIGSNNRTLSAKLDFKNTADCT